ncbi:hypothetical protein H5410_000257 [Solanum commersonii]|uniref:Uncharacterized protein n=1 Tax=Solanum commersonii TaxID=4109 RepID=A0A9J6AVS4_SOLCO|nr:hypothetical protein H5410_000257 [Solanum commersonii]
MLSGLTRRKNQDLVYFKFQSFTVYGTNVHNCSQGGTDITISFESDQDLIVQILSILIARTTSSKYFLNIGQHASIEVVSNMHVFTCCLSLAEQVVAGAGGGGDLGGGGGGDLGGGGGGEHGRGLGRGRGRGLGLGGGHGCGQGYGHDKC